MAVKRKAENETIEESRKRNILTAIANAASRSDKTSWNRKMDNMVKLIAELRPIEQQIIKLENKKIPIIDKIQELRGMMVNECIHPYEDLALKDDVVECKFCYKKIGIPNEFRDEESS